MVLGIFTHLKWSLVPPDFKDSLENCSNLKKVQPVESEVLIDLKNIEIPDNVQCLSLTDRPDVTNIYSYVL